MIGQEPSVPPTIAPMLDPSALPSNLPTVTPSQSDFPSFIPTVAPTATPSMSAQPSATPTLSAQPTASPTSSLRPSAIPTESLNPSGLPTVGPTSTASPSLRPSSFPSRFPSIQPTVFPTTIPTLSEALVEARSFRQPFLLSEQEFNDTAKSLVAGLFESYTAMFHPDPQRVVTTCSITDQASFRCTETDEDCVVENSTLPITSLFLTDVDYSCRWSSVVTAVNGSAVEFENYIDGNLQTVTLDMQARSLPVLNAFETRGTAQDPPTTGPTVSPAPTIVASSSPSFLPTGAPSSTWSPTVSPRPSLVPTQSNRPTATPRPTDLPSASPTISTLPTMSLKPTVSPTLSSERPTELPSVFPSMWPSLVPSEAPTSRPSAAPQVAPTETPTASLRPTMALVPSEDFVPQDTNPEATIIVVVVVVAGVATAVAFVAWCWRRRKTSEAYFYNQNDLAVVSDPRHNGTPHIDPWKTAARAGTTKTLPPHELGSDVGVVIGSPSESLVSRQSLLSAGESGLGEESDIEADNTRNLQDEFDQYKDQNIEQLRSDVEGNVSGFEGIMSAAVTRALMGDDYPQVELSSELSWGCSANATGAEIEACVLCEVNSWLKRKESATVDQKRAFMQDILNRMVSSVRCGVLPADDASRTIHESAALLGLQLAHQLPMTTIIISGMRKGSGASHMKVVLREFGDLDTVATASGQRGFGIVRYRNPKSVDRVMRRYRNGEIVIQDVAVQMKFLTPSGHVESRKR